MIKLHRATGMLAITLGLVLLPSLAKTVNAQEGAVPAATSGTAGRIDLGMNFTYEFAQIADPQQTRFILPGISVDGAFNLDKSRSFAIVGEIDGQLVHNIVPTVDLQQVSLIGGPRYTIHLAKSSNHGLDIYGQALAGRLWASNSVFPGPSGILYKADTGIFQAGGGLNLHLGKSIALRIVEADWVVTGLPNYANNKQYDVKLSNGVIFHF